MNPTRNGKIARLPKSVREELNRRLQDGEQGKTLVSWLNGLESVMTILRDQFGGRAVTEQNLSEWKQGGYLDWEQQQQVYERVQHIAEHADTLRGLGDKNLADQLALVLAGQYAEVIASALNHPDFTQPENLALLRNLCADIVALRRGDHSQKRLELEEGQLKLDREKLREITDAEHWAWAEENDILETLCRRKSVKKAGMEVLISNIWGPRPNPPEGGQEPPSNHTNAETVASNPTESDSIRPDPTSFSEAA